MKSGTDTIDIGGPIVVGITIVVDIAEVVRIADFTEITLINISLLFY